MSNGFEKMQDTAEGDAGLGSAISRRDCLRAACGLAASSMIGSVAAGETARPQTAPRAAKSTPTTLPALGDRPTTPPVADTAKSIVVHIQAEEALSGTRVHPTLAGEMVEEALKVLARKDDPKAAWRAVLKPDDRIAIKFNHVGADILGTTVPFGVQLVDSLEAAGFARDQIMLIEAPGELYRVTRTRPPVFGWSKPEVSFGSGAEQLAAWLDEVTAIINVPFIKTHNIAGMTGCLKNLSHALIRRPGRYHANGCAPFIGDIVSLPQIRSKLRLHVVNALQAVFDGGPEARLSTIWPHRGVIVGTDPVAVDSIGLGILNDQREAARLPAIGDSLGRVAYLHAAAEKGLGTDDQDYITLLEPRPF